MILGKIILRRVPYGSGVRLGASVDGRGTVGAPAPCTRGLLAGDSCCVIARRLGRAPSTVSRDVAAAGHRLRYRGWRADETAHRRARRPKIAKLIAVPRLRRAVERGLRRRWSPQQITARLVLDYPDDLEMRVSHETIYQSLFVQGRGALRQELTRWTSLR